MSEHTKEPWRYTPSETEEDAGSVYAVTGAGITGADSESIFRIDLGEIAGLDDDNARRIVACVNACAGISTENLENNRPLKWLIDRYNSVIKERDAVRAALDTIAHSNRTKTGLKELAKAALFPAQEAE